MPNVLDKQDMFFIHTLLRHDSPSAMYSVLYDRGYAYGTLGEGVVNQSSLAGGAAGNFMKLTAQRMGKHLTDDHIYHVYNGMAWGYLNALEKQFKTQGAVTRDINHKEAWEFHNRVFLNVGLSEDAWTLNSVFKIMANDTIREQYWNEVLMAAGDPFAEALIAVKTESFMATASVIGTPEVKAIADNWRARIDVPSTIIASGYGVANMLGERVDALFARAQQNILQAVHAAPTAQSWVPSANPTPTPVPNVVAPAHTALPPMTHPAPPPRRRRNRGRRLPPPTTYQGHPGSGYDRNIGGRIGPRLFLE